MDGSMPPSPLLRATASIAAGAALLALAACGQDGTGAGGTTTKTHHTSGSGGADASVPPQPLTVLNWNCHDFFNDKKDSTLAQELVVSASTYKTHLANVAAVIKALSPDIAVLQEIENQAVLDDLNQALGGGYANRAITEGNDPRGIDVAVLSRLPFDGMPVFHATDSFVLAGTNGPKYNYSRDLLELHYVVNGRRLVLLGVHLKSKVAMDDGDKRLAEAQHTRAIADALTAADPGLGLLILGDFNDVTGSPPVLAAEGAAPSLYTDACDEIAAADRWSYLFNGANELIDHQLDSPLVQPMLDASSVTIRHDKDVNASSDHSPVFARYLVR